VDIRVDKALKIQKKRIGTTAVTGMPAEQAKPAKPAKQANRAKQGQTTETAQLTRRNERLAPDPTDSRGVFYCFRPREQFGRIADATGGSPRCSA
jgi:hypothetical protein